MPLEVTCASCHSTFRVKEAHAGKRGTCPRCKSSVAVPTVPVQEDVEASEALPLKRKPNQQLGMQEILEAFTGEIPPVKRTFGYVVGSLILTVAMLILPAIYLAMIAAIAYLLFVHATTNIGPKSPIRGFWSLFFLYFGPLVAGVVLLFFMIKPMFARRSRSRTLRTLQFGEEPLLFALVTRIAKAVEAPEPKQIALDCRANASASFGTQLGAMTGGDLILTIGLPLAAGMNVQQLSGVIAHELGHFSQGAGMRLSFVVRSINAWF